MCSTNTSSFHWWLVIVYQISGGKLASFPGHSHHQYLLAYSMKYGGGRPWRYGHVQCHQVDTRKAVPNEEPWAMQHIHNVFAWLHMAKSNCIVPRVHSGRQSGISPPIDWETTAPHDAAVVYFTEYLSVLFQLTYLDELYRERNGTAHTWTNSGYQALFSPYRAPGNKAIPWHSNEGEVLLVVPIWCWQSLQNNHTNLALYILENSFSKVGTTVVMNELAIHNHDCWHFPRSRAEKRHYCHDEEAVFLSTTHHHH